jgi:hypothetical protein
MPHLQASQNSHTAKFSKKNTQKIFVKHFFPDI